MSFEGPRRLFEGDESSGLLRGALEAERADAVDEPRLRRIEQAVAMIGAGVAAPSSSSPADGATSVKPAAGGVASKGPLVLLAAATLGGLAVVFSVSGEPAPATRPAPQRGPEVVAAPDAPREPEPRPAEPTIATLSPADLPTAPAPPPSAKTARATTSATESDEIALLARAHDALHDDPARSLALCREHEARFSGGHFAQEREAVAVEALVYLGHKDDAARRWSEFQRRYPSSSHRVHLASLFAASPAP
ncbi:MAG: hypothetical protein KF764_29585 [Labilithrix sp.]|nr:hypothetical protein [Labilithrix sp.]